MRTDDPAHDWDVYSAEQEEARAAYVRGRTCKDCAHCHEPPDRASAWGWCDVNGDYTELEEPVNETECEDFE